MTNTVIVGQVCKSIDEYETAIVAASENASHGGSCIFPTLSRNAGTLWSARTVNRLISIAGSVARPEHYCIIASDDTLALAGAAYAAATKKTLLVLETAQDINKISSLVNGDAASALLVLSPRSIVNIGCDCIASFFRPDTAYGIMTASSLSAMSRLIARLRNRPLQMPKSGHIYSTLPMTPLCSSSELTAQLIGSEPESQLRWLAENDAAFVSFVGHGRSYCALAGNLCSRTTQGMVGDKCCAGDWSCVFPTRERIPASHLRADVVLIDSCSTANFLHPGPEQDFGINLSTHLLDGFACAVIAPWRTNIPLRLTPYLAWALAARGNTLGEIVGRLNHLANVRRCSRSPYLLLGDPEMQVFAPRRSSPTLPVESVESGVWAVQVRLSTEPTLHRIDPSTVLCDNAFSLSSPGVLTELLTLPDDSSAFELLSIPDGAQIGSEVPVLIASRPPVDSNLFRYSSQITSSIDREIKLLFRHYTEESAQARGSLNHACEYLSDNERNFLACELPPITIENYLRLGVIGHELVKRTTEAERTFFEALIARARRKELWLYAEYAEAVGIRSIHAQDCYESCPTCGSILTCRQYEVGLLPIGVRLLYECERCMLVCDVPSSVRICSVHCNGPVLRGQKNRFTIQGFVRQPTVSGICFVGISVDTMGIEADSFQYSPSISELQADESGYFVCEPTIYFDLNVPKHLFHVKALIYTGGALSWAMCKVEIQGAKPL